METECVLICTLSVYVNGSGNWDNQCTNANGNQQTISITVKTLSDFNH